MRRKSKRTKTTNPRNDKPDRLSTLPDALLIDIISLLPIKSAVSTSALSQRWRNLWTQLTCITLDYRHFQGGSSNFYSISDRIISQLTSPFIRSFTLDLHNSSEFSSSIVDSWLRKICANNVQLIEVNFGSTCNRTLCFNPPPCVLQTQSLVHLQLINYHEYEFPDVEINLPNLKHLALLLPLSQCWIVAKLTRACPLLEHLNLMASRGSSDQHAVIIDISSQNLKALVLNFLLSQDATKFLINAPNLNCLYFFAGTSSDFCWVTYPSALFMVAIRASSKTLVLSLLKSISSVQMLLINLIALNVLKGYKEKENDGKPLIFDDLKYLSLALLHPTVDELSWTATDCMPSTFLTHVKTIKIQISKLTNEIHLLNLIKFLLNSARVLEKLTVSVISTSANGTHDKNEDELFREAQFISELLDCPQTSSQCQIEFSGKYVIISADGVKLRTADGRIVSL